jgi:hypothetical protein
MRPLAQPAFIDEDNGLALFLAFLLSSGQRSRFHRWMAASLRSKARPFRERLLGNCSRFWLELWQRF